MFESLLRLLQWSWGTFGASLQDAVDLRGKELTAATLDLERLVYIATACLRLLRTYVCEIYPSPGKSILNKNLIGFYDKSYSRENSKNLYQHQKRKSKY